MTSTDQLDSEPLAISHGRQTVYSAEVCSVRGWLVVDRLNNDLAFGGFRFDPAVSLEQVRRLAHTMSWKLAAHGLPVGGAKAGLSARPDHPRMDEILAGLADAWREPLCRHAIVGKDMGASNSLLDRLYEHLGQPQLGVVQARAPQCPDRIRDLTGYVRDMTALGAVIAAEAATGSLDGKRLLIQGAGLVGAGVAVRAARRGAIVVGISDVDGAFYCRDGLPVHEYVSSARESGRPFELERLSEAGFERQPRDSLLGHDADILVLAAGSHVVCAELAQSVQARTVVEASNFGLTDEGNRVLWERNITVVPDVISSSSSAAMTSHQLSTGNGWEHDAIWTRIERDIRDAVARSLAATEHRRRPLREAYAEVYGDLLRQ